MENQEAQFKIKGQKSGGFNAYRQLVYGEQPLRKLILGELLTLLIGGIPGALGIVLRAKLYPFLFAQTGKGVIFGRRLTLRHTHKIRLGDHVILDDFAVIDAKGLANKGIELGNGVYIGRSSIVYCKGGNIILEDRVNLSANCTLFSSNDLHIGAGTMIGAYTYVLSGGEYDHHADIPFADQDGMETKGPCRIGKNCWLGARVTVLDGVKIGDHSVMAAGAVVTRSFPEKSVIGGIPAKSISKS